MRNFLSEEITQYCEARYLMGTLVEITAYGINIDIQCLVHKAFDEFERLEKMFNFFDPESELSYVNQKAFQCAVTVSQEFFEVVAQGLAYSKSARGWFSVTLAPLMQLWRQCERENRFPTSSELAFARYLTHWRLVSLDHKRCCISFAEQGVALDFSGFAKGYAVDKARRVFERDEIVGAFINAGTSSIATIGVPVNGESWKVGISRPSDKHQVIGTLTLTNNSISTSGTTEHRFIIRDTLFSHLLNPKTGVPIKNLASATVIAESGMQAEVASKLLILLNCKNGIAFCDANNWNVEGFTLLERSDQDSVIIEQSKAINLHIS